MKNGGTVQNVFTTMNEKKNHQSRHLTGNDQSDGMRSLISLANEKTWRVKTATLHIQPGKYERGPS